MRELLVLPGCEFHDLFASVDINASTPEDRAKVDFGAADDEDDILAENIQIAELNTLDARCGPR